MSWILPVGLAGAAAGIAAAYELSFDHYAQESVGLFTQLYPDLAARANIPTAQAQSLSSDDQAKRLQAINALQGFAHAYTSAQIADDFAPFLGTENASNFSRWLGETLEKYTHLEPTAFNAGDRNRDLWNDDYGLSHLIGMTKEEKAAALQEEIDKYLHGDPAGPIFDWQDPRTYIHTPTPVAPEAVPELSALQPFFNGFLPNGEQGSADPLNPANFIAQSIPNFTIARAHLDPLAVDLNRDGHIATTGQDKVYFDADNDGMKEAVSWVGAEDGFLARDLNGNGVIDGMSELFGGAARGSGFAALKALDSNHDGKIDAQDAAFSSLKIWQDLNQDGISQAGELLSVRDDVFFAELPTAESAPGSNTATIVAAVGNVLAQDIDLLTDQVNTVYGGSAPLSFAALSQPELRGYGNLPNLSVAMSLDPTLLAKSQALSSQTLLHVVSNFGAFRGGFDHLLYTWAGVDDVSPQARGTFLDARVLGFMEKMFQQNFTQAGTAGNTNPLSLPAQDITGIYESIRESLMGRFLLQMGAGALYDAPVSYDPLTDAVHFTGTPHLSSEILNQLGAEASFSATPDQFWAALAYVIDATHNGANITPANIVVEPGFFSITITQPGAGEGLATLSTAETAALDHAAQMAGLTWSGIQSSFLANLPPAPVVADPEQGLYYWTGARQGLAGWGCTF